MSRSRNLQQSANRGSVFDFAFTWPDSAGPADLSGWEIAAMDVSPTIANLLTVAITDAPNGEVEGKIAWDDAIEANKTYTFRLQITKAGEDPDSTNLIEVTYY